LLSRKLFVEILTKHHLDLLTYLRAVGCIILLVDVDTAADAETQNRGREGKFKISGSAQL